MLNKYILNNSIENNLRKILLISDTHGYLDENIIKYARTVDEIWHAGDIGNIKIADKLKKIKTLKGVYGNIDSHEIRKEYPLNCVFNCENVKVWITHIGGYPNRYGKRIKEGLKFYKPDLFICGHSHILKIIYDNKNNLLHMNPGAIGKHGFHKKRTMIRFEINKKIIANVEVIEFDR